MSFLRNIVNDMWEKRLLPVAVVLLLAAAAIPLLLLKSERSQPQAGKEPAATSKQSIPASAGQSIVTIDDQLKLERKKLDAFKKKDPFIQQGLGSDPSSGSVTPTDSKDSGATSGDTSTGDTSTGDTTGGGDTGTPSTGGDGSSGKLFTMTVTLRFGLLGKGFNGDDKVKKNVVPVTPFPSAKNPIASFIGISSSSPSAIFLLDRGVRQKGEGTCMPSSSYCQLLYLRVESDRNEHTFYRASDPDRKYGIKLRSIDLTSVTEEDIFEAKASKSWKLK